MLYVAERRPRHRGTDGGWDLPRTQEKQIVRNRDVFYVQRGDSSLRDQSAFGDLSDPEETGRTDTGIKVVNLRPRTGVEEVDSYQNKRAPMMCAIHGHILTLKHSHVAHQVVCLAVAARGSSSKGCLGHKTPEIGYAVGLNINTIKAERGRPWQKIVDERRDHVATGDGHRLGASRRS